MAYEEQIEKDVKKILELCHREEDLGKFLVSYFSFMHRNYGHEELLFTYYQRMQQLIAFCEEYQIDLMSLSNYRIDELLNCFSFHFKKQDIVRIAQAKHDSEIEKIMESIEKNDDSTSNFE